MWFNLGKERIIDIDDNWNWNLPQEVILINESYKRREDKRISNQK
jgi:hypothetical protein